ncbi:MAG: hypothetical protein A2498_04560 [Lentisphaerae bacterium RIFOXYC12_FULL_60_16]|nr:MAG: hypothetical protein A2498_04560 [Lentisphaerae bacterium RIFOXYC12_FULL_60_16]OGV74270.1 MAG: hypothetical protein A2269_00515 [Lentisphaerae bacterium RIFOXYA12_FULL_60_10]OGV84842.1 MAG: hypothetical protein A2340_16460 [Lentisphaerae bacterium RIFOXYB12_FULL_60_10]
MTENKAPILNKRPASTTKPAGTPAVSGTATPKPPAPKVAAPKSAALPPGVHPPSMGRMLVQMVLLAVVGVSVGLVILEKKKTRKLTGLNADMRSKATKLEQTIGKWKEADKVLRNNILILSNQVAESRFMLGEEKSTTEPLRREMEKLLAENITQKATIDTLMADGDAKAETLRQFEAERIQSREAMAVLKIDLEKVQAQLARMTAEPEPEPAPVIPVEGEPAPVEAGGDAVPEIVPVEPEAVVPAVEPPVQPDVVPAEPAIEAEAVVPAPAAVEPVPAEEPAPEAAAEAVPEVVPDQP